MVQLLIRTAGSTRRHPVTLEHGEDLDALGRKVSEATGLPASQLSLVHKGKALRGSDLLSLGENDVIFAAGKPRLPPSHVHQQRNKVEKEEAEEAEEDDAALELPASSSNMQHAIARVLREKLQCPDVVLVAFFWFSLRTWLCILLWFCLAPVVHHFLELGPIYILATCFALIFCNLGTRREGEASAYSIFNEGFQELPGTLNADRMDQQIRAGQF